MSGYKRIWGLLLAILLAAAGLPGYAFAADAASLGLSPTISPLGLSSKAIDLDNRADGSGWRWAGAALEITTAGSYVLKGTEGTIYPLQIIVKENVSLSTAQPLRIERGHVLRAMLTVDPAKTLTFTGGSLAVENPAPPSSSHPSTLWGSYGAQGNIVVTGGSLKLTGGNCGLYGDAAVSGGSLEATGPTGIWGDVSVSGDGRVTAASNGHHLVVIDQISEFLSIVGSRGHGVFGNVRIKDSGAVTATSLYSTPPNNETYGICGDVFLESGQLTARANYGVYGRITLGDGEITADGSRNGIASTARFTGHNGILNVKSGTDDRFSYQFDVVVVEADDLTGYRWNVQNGSIYQQDGNKALIQVPLGDGSQPYTVIRQEANVNTPGRWWTGGNSGSGSGSSGGSGSGKGGGSTATATTAAPQNTPRPVTTETAVGAVNTALQSMRSAGGAAATARLKNPGAVGLEALQAMSKAAGGTSLTVHADSYTEDGKSVDVRIAFDPAGATKAVDLSASTTSQRARRTKAYFEKWFSNKVSVVSCTQQGGFGMKVEIAAKPDSALNTKALVFYTYDRATNTYKQITPTPGYWIDSAGYLHFTTDQAGDLLITDQPLMKK